MSFKLSWLAILSISLYLYWFSCYLFHQVLRDYSCEFLYFSYSLLLLFASCFSRLCYQVYKHLVLSCIMMVWILYHLKIISFISGDILSYEIYVWFLCSYSSFLLTYILLAWYILSCSFILNLFMSLKYASVRQRIAFLSCRTLVSFNWDIRATYVKCGYYLQILYVAICCFSYI